MSWKKHFTTYNGQQSPISGAKKGGNATSNSFQSWLPEVYTGQPNRLERYMQYDQMDQDSEINTALDTIAEFSTQQDESTTTPFVVEWNDDPTETESEVLQTVLKQWCRVNDWDRRLFNTFRNAVKYGDQPFVRDPETWKLYYINASDVQRVIVDEANGKEPAQYVVKNLDPNFQTLMATTPHAGGHQTTGLGAHQGRNVGQVGNVSVNGMGSETETTVDASHIVHIAITDGMDLAWPFGNSILDAIFKTYKQKELLEDSIIIYRVQRAPERRIFYIDVGDMPAHQAMSHVERVKNEIHQRRIPSKTGGGSNMMDAQYNPLCLSLDTTVPLLDGRTLPLTELITEYQNGIENWTYSCDPITGKIVPGNITWAGVTRKNTQVVKLHMDDGSTVTVTPDHKIPVLGKGFVEAQHLTAEDSLVSFKTREQGLSSSSSDRTYTQIYDHESNSWEYSHRIVGKFFRNIQKHQEFTYLPENKDAHKNIVHHKDFNRYNNDPRNLQWMNKEDHVKYHSEQNMWQHLTVDESDRIKAKISTSVKALWASGVYDVNNIKNAQKKFVYLRNNDEQFKATYKIAQSKSRKNFLKNNPEFITDVLLPNLGKWSETIPNQTKVYTFAQLQAIYDLAAKHDFKMKNMVLASDDHGPVLSAIKETNTPESGKNFKINTNKLTQQVIYNTIHHFGYKNWMDFKRKKCEFNHRVVSIEWLDELQDTGTITIDGDEKWHNHHTFPVNGSIFVKNSIMEDYFFAQTAEGRGSKVDTLPGGDNLGDIDDLKFFNNKLARGLRIPSSYLPTGPDDGTASINDGRQGTAFIQEYRFTQYCRRLQRMVQPTFDKEFKLFLKHRGYEIDSSQFVLNFVEPQSFSDYREIEINGARAGVFGQLEGVEYLSKRFALKKYLQLTDDEILENEKMYKQENPLKGDNGSAVDDEEFSDLGSVGVQGGADGSLDDFESDEELDGEFDDEFADEGESAISGAEGDDDEEEPT
jgi:hypothetical protein